MSCCLLLQAQGQPGDFITTSRWEFIVTPGRGSWVSHGMSKIVTQSCQHGFVLSQQGSLLWDADFPKPRLSQILGWEGPLSPQKYSQIHGGFTLSWSSHSCPKQVTASFKYGFQCAVPKLKAPPASLGPAGNLKLISKEPQTICCFMFFPSATIN